MRQADERVTRTLLWNLLERRLPEMRMQLPEGLQHMFEQQVEMLRQDLQEESLADDLSLSSPNQDTLNMIWLRELSRDTGQRIYYRHLTKQSAKNLRMRIGRKTHPWNGCTITTEDALDPGQVAVYIHTGS